MNSYPEQTEQISIYQDEVVTLRQDVPKLYKGFLMKECQVVANKLADAKFDIPRQNLEALKNLYRNQVDLEGTRLRDSSVSARQLHNYAQMLRQYTQGEQTTATK
ncbi:hypothetical protein RP20_CCG008233 [Aedes albopictus]|nr:hypothetical protein RP20_CCG008233 [Aedes albopictus]